MEWLNNIESVLKNKNSGMCPFCKSSNTNYSADKVNDDYGYCVVWCNDCKRALNISIMKISDDMVTNNEIPKDLIF